jgi:hypothetical protein
VGLPRSATRRGTGSASGIVARRRMVTGRAGAAPFMWIDSGSRLALARLPTPGLPAPVRSPGPRPCARWARCIPSSEASRASAQRLAASFERGTADPRKVPEAARGQHHQHRVLRMSVNPCQRAGWASPTRTTQRSGTMPITSPGARAIRARPGCRHSESSTSRSGLPGR